MGWLFRRHFWIINLVLLAIAAFVLAKAVNVVVSYRLAVAYKVKPRVKRVVRQSTKRMDRNFDIANKRNIFQAKREDIIPEDVEISNKKDDIAYSNRWQDAVLSDLQVKLMGTAVFRDPYDSLALIADLSKGMDADVKNYSINNCSDQSLVEDVFLQEVSANNLAAFEQPYNRLVGVAVINRIEPNRVYIFNEEQSRYEYLVFDDNKKMDFPIIKPVSKAPATINIGKNIRKIGTNSYEIEQNELDDALSNLSRIVTQARVVPAFENGQTVGFKIFSIRANSIFQKLGLKNGDIIKQINGYSLNSPNKALELYQKLKLSKSFTMDLKHRGQAMTLHYSVVP